jgi:hypothetical protein
MLQACYVEGSELPEGQSSASVDEQVRSAAARAAAAAAVRAQERDATRKHMESYRAKNAQTRRKQPHADFFRQERPRYPSMNYNPLQICIEPETPARLIV